MTAHDVAQLRADEADHDHVILLEGATWGDYERLDRIRGDRALPRLTYSKGLLEIMSPSISHESIASNLGRLVEVYCEEMQIEHQAFRSWTLKNKARKSGTEADECYVFNTRPKPARPELAIEVEWTSRALDKLEAYRALKVREVWFWRRGAITIWILGADGYAEAAKSKVLPGIDVGELCSFVDRPLSIAKRDYREHLRRRVKVKR